MKRKMIYHKIYIYILLKFIKGINKGNFKGFSVGISWKLAKVKLQIDIRILYKGVKSMEMISHQCWLMCHHQCYQ